MIIGLGYKAGVGKDMIANHLVVAHGFKRLAFGDIIRACVCVVMGWDPGSMTDRELKEIVDKFWGMSRRQGTQRMGDALRNEFGDWVLVKSMSAAINNAIGRGEHVVISDLRKFVEVNFVVAVGGYNVHVNRRSAESVSAHKTETELDAYMGWDADINNNGTPNDAYDQMDALVKRLKTSDKTMNQLIDADAVIAKLIAEQQHYNPSPAQLAIAAEKNK